MFFKLGDELLRRGIEFACLDQAVVQEVDQRWLDAYAWAVKAKHGVPIYNGFRWHGFFHHLQPCLAGDDASAAYQEQWQAPFYLFDEDLSFCALCPAQAYPDLLALRRDVYVAHRNMKWTMAFTHEQPQIGPFFAQRPNA